MNDIQRRDSDFTIGESDAGKRGLHAVEHPDVDNIDLTDDVTLHWSYPQALTRRFAPDADAVAQEAGGR